MVRATLIAGLSAVALAAGLDAAGGKGKGFGTPPYKCGHDAIGQSGCYGSDVGPNVMDDAGNGNINISPHLVEVGEYVSMTVVGDSTPNWVPAAGLKPRNCKPGAMTCVFKAVSATGGWQRYQMGFGLGAREQDYYGVTGKDKLEAIEGTLSKADRSPIKNAAVKISGPTTKTVKTDSTGSFRAKVKPGAYTVTPAPKVCRLPLGQQGCERAAKVAVGPAASVNFRAAGTFKLSGTVMTAACEACGTNRAPLEGARVVAQPQRGNALRGESITKADGTYEMELETETYDVSVAEPAGGMPERQVVALGGDVQKVDFEVCPSGTQSRQAELGLCVFTIDMTAVDLTGGPLAGAEIHASRENGSGDASVVTDATGAAKLKLPPGKWFLFLASDLEQLQTSDVWADENAYPQRATRCQDGTIGPPFGRGPDAPYFRGCNLELQLGDEPTQFVDFQAGLFPVVVDLKTTLPGGQMRVYDSQPAAGHHLRGRGLNIPIGGLNNLRRHHRLLVPSYDDFRQQNPIVDLLDYRGNRIRQVPFTTCAPRQSDDGKSCWLRLRAGAAGTGHVVFKP